MNGVIGIFERPCACCGKIFIVTYPTLYAYKIKDFPIQKWYCGYKCWIQEVRKKEKDIVNSHEAYYERLRENKNKTEKRRRDKKNATT